MLKRRERLTPSSGTIYSSIVTRLYFLDLNCNQQKKNGVKLFEKIKINREILLLSFECLNPNFILKKDLCFSA